MFLYLIDLRVVKGNKNLWGLKAKLEGTTRTVANERKKEINKYNFKISPLYSPGAESL